MYQVKTTCPTCDVVTVPAEDVTLRMCSASGDCSSYSFRCPGCDRSVAHPADEVATTLLLSAGVTIVVWGPPAELDEPRSGPPIAEADLVALRTALEEPGWFDRLAAMVTTDPDQR